MKYLLIVCLLFVFTTSPVVAAEPTYGEAFVDGDESEWAPQDFFADMYKAGNPDKDILAESYLRYDCGTHTLYVYVHAVNPYTIEGNPGEDWVKISADNGAIVVNTDNNDGVPPDFAFVHDGNVVGWEASARLNPGTYTIFIHTNVLAPRSETASTIRNGMALDVTCETLGESEWELFPSVPRLWIPMVE